MRILTREAKFHEISLARTRRKVMSFTENIHFPREICTAFSGEVEIKRCRHDLPWSRFDEKPCTRSRFLQYVVVDEELRKGAELIGKPHTPSVFLRFRLAPKSRPDFRKVYVLKHLVKNHDLRRNLPTKKCAPCKPNPQQQITPIQRA